MSEQQLSDRQQKVLRQMAKSSSKAVHAILDDEKVSVEEFTEWRRQPAFRQAYRALRARMKFCIEFDLVRAAWMAARRLAIASGGEKQSDMRNGVGVFLLQLVRTAYGSTFRRRIREAEPIPPMLHPSLGADQAARLYAEMKSEMRKTGPWCQDDGDCDDDA